jgi:LETM1 and EF-hand domain-containing protein 1
MPTKVAEVAEENVKIDLAKKDKDKPKGSLPTRAWAVVKKEAAHYWAGTKLLGHEIKISAKLLRVVLRGEELTRRERRQVRIPQ